jgi:hypothetical protein
MHLRWKSQRLSDTGEPRVDYYAGLGIPPERGR